MRTFYAMLTVLIASLLLIFGSTNPVISQAATTNTPAGQVHSWIAFTSDRDGAPAIYVMATDGTNVHRLTDINCDHAAWSPDGKKIAFEAIQPGIRQIFVMNNDG